MKILIVDDDPIVVQSCCRILDAEGFDIHCAGSVEAGEKILAEQDFDLMLTDIKMPGRDGFDMIQRAKNIRPDISILVMTGYLMPETIDEGRRFGVKNYISKPFTPAELVLAIQNM